MKLSIIMRTKNSDWVVEQALRALHSQTANNFELLVVDSGSTDRTLEIVRRYRPILIEIPANAYIPGAVLNQAIGKASGDVIVFQNSDTVPLHPFSLERLLEPLHEPNVVATFARQIPRPEAASWVRRDYATSFPAKGEAPQWMPLSLPFAAMHKWTWTKHRFHTAAWGSEDVEWGIWARREKYTVRYVPECVVMHSHNYSIREAFGRRFIEGEADAFIHGGHDSPIQAIRRILGSAAQDMVYQQRIGDWREAVVAPIRRTSFHLGYYWGHKHGERRRAGTSVDAELGQRLVLERLGGSGAREDR
jgi:rhamnosyltransferase